MTWFALLFVSFISVTSILVYSESRHWGDTPPLALLLLFIGFISLPFSLLQVLASDNVANTILWTVTGMVSLVAGWVGILGSGLHVLLLLSSFSACIVATIFMLG